jgi:peptide/nickel transport system permease protein
MVNASNKYLPASWEHPFGTDWMGLDVFRQVLAGTEGVLQVAFYTAVISIFMGTVLGILSGYIGGWVDRVIMVIVNIFLSVPSFPVYLMLAALLTIETPMAMAVVISVFSWAGLCRAIRVQVISLKESDFIQICRVMNMSTGHIIFKEIMPNLFSYIAVNFVLILRGSILASVGIMLVGLASYNPTDWGVIIQAARMRGLMNMDNVRIMLYPLAAILIFQIAALMLAQGLDETFNPRLKVL